MKQMPPRGTAELILFILASALFSFCAAAVALTGTGLVIKAGSILVLVGAGFAAIVVLVTVLARFSRRTGPIRTVSFILPLFLFGITLLLCFGGDAQEHLVRGFLHHLHRAIPQDWVVWSMTGVILLVPLLSATLLWVAISLLSSFELKVPPILCASAWSIIDFGLALSAPICLFVKKDVIIGVTLSGLALAVTALVFLAFRQLFTNPRPKRVLALPIGTLLLFALAFGVTLLMSSPEVRRPEAPAAQTIDVRNANSVMAGLKPWTCFPLLTDFAWSWSAAALRNTAPSSCGENVPRRPARFKAEPSRAKGTNLWLDDGPQRRLLKRYACGEIRIDEINEDRVVVTGCTQLEVFDAQGNQVGFVDFVRPEVRSASISEDRSRFIIIVYLIGFGDPPHLEEETVVVYNAESARPVLAARLDRIPNSTAWGGLSPEGSTLAVTIDKTLRLFRLPPEKDEPGR